VNTYLFSIRCCWSRHPESSCRSRLFICALLPSWPGRKTASCRKVRPLFPPNKPACVFLGDCWHPTAFFAFSKSRAFSLRQLPVLLTPTAFTVLSLPFCSECELPTSSTFFAHRALPFPTWDVFYSRASYSGSRQTSWPRRTPEP